MTSDRPDPAPRDPDAPDPTRAPTWVRSLLIGLALAALVVIVVMVLLGGEHGPGRHG